MGGIGSMDTSQDAEVINSLGDFREQFANGETAFSMLSELPGRLEEVSLLRESDSWEFEGQRFAVVTIEKGLRIKGVDVRRAALHEEKDDSFCSSGKMRLPRVTFVSCETVASKKGMKSNRAKPERGLAKKITALEGILH
jgi:hypothetical protein